MYTCHSVIHGANAGGTNVQRTCVCGVVLGSIPGGCPGFFFMFSSGWLTNVDGMKDLLCSSTVWLLSTQHCKNKRVSLTYLRLPELHSYRNCMNATHLRSPEFNPGNLRWVSLTHFRLPELRSYNYPCILGYISCIHTIGYLSCIHTIVCMQLR